MGLSGCPSIAARVRGRADRRCPRQGIAALRAALAADPAGRAQHRAGKGLGRAGRGSDARDLVCRRARLPAAGGGGRTLERAHRSRAGAIAARRPRRPLRAAAAGDRARAGARSGPRFRRRADRAGAGRPGRPRGPALGRDIASAGIVRTPGIPRHRQRPLPRRPAKGTAANPGRGERPGRMAVRLRRPAFGHHQRRRTD